METVTESNEMPDRGNVLRKGFRMGEWMVRPIEGLIDGRLGTRHLQPKSMDVLLCLACSPNHIVERDELIEQVWGHTAVTDEPLTRCIHEIRRELSDTRDHPTYIQTIPKRGYRLVAPVEPAEEILIRKSAADGAGALRNSEAPGDGHGARERLIVQLIKHRVVWVGAIYASVAWALTRIAVYSTDSLLHGYGAPDWLLPMFVTMLFLGFPLSIFLAWAYEEAENSAPGANRRGMFRLLLSRRGIDLAAITLLFGAFAIMALDLRPVPVVASAQDFSRIAVLPFAIEGDDRTAGWLGRGIAEDLLKLLTQVEELEVAAWTSSFRSFPETADIQEIGRDLNVHYVLTGRLLRDRDQLRVSAQLFDAQTGSRVWSDVFDRSASDLFVIEDEIARQAIVAMQLAMPFGFAEQAEALAGAVLPATVPPTTSVKAYDYYLQARNILQRSTASVSLEEAAELFTRAIRYDGGFAMAYGGLCTTLVRQIESGTVAGVTDLAASVCRQSVTLAPESLDSHTAFGDFYRVSDQSARAIDEYQWVIGRQPRAVDAHLGLGGAYADLEDLEHAEQAFRRAIEIQPDYAAAYKGYSDFLFVHGRYREIVEIGRRLIQLDPGSVSGYRTLGDASLASGQFDTAIAAFQEIIRREPTSKAFSSLGAGYYYRGRYQAAALMFTRATDLAPLEHRFWGELGDAYTQIGNRQDETERAYQRARDLAESDQQIAPNDPVTAIYLAYYCAAVNDRPCANAFRSSAVALAPMEPDIHYYSALIDMRLGHEAAAIAAAERALALGYPRALFTVDPLLASVRNSPRLAGIAFGHRALARNDRVDTGVSALFW